MINKMVVVLYIRLRGDKNMNKVKKVLICINILFTIILGIIIAQISILLYRYNRMQTFLESNELLDELLINLQNKVLIMWIIWGILSIFLIIQLLSKGEKKGLS